MAILARLNRSAATQARPRDAAEEATTDDVRRATGRLVGGVCVITRGTGEARMAVTATSVSSLGADPPSLIVCVKRTASIGPSPSPGALFGVSMLSADQCEFAERFAGGADLNGAERDWEGWRALANGVLVLADAAAVFSCEVEAVNERHAQEIVIARVRAAAIGSGSGALVHWRGGYDRIGWSADEVSRAVGLTPLAGR